MPHLQALPVEGGTYILVSEAPEAFVVTVGRLGRHRLAAGWYLYVGSAFGPGGLAARCGRHLRSDKPKRWHLDYVSPYLEPREIWYRCGPRRLEHEWTQALTALKGTAAAWPGFGASDCRCPSHLWYRSCRPQAGAFRRAAADGLIKRMPVGDRKG